MFWKCRKMSSKALSGKRENLNYFQWTERIWNEENSEADNYLEIDFKYAIAYMSVWISEKSNINS